MSYTSGEPQREDRRHDQRDQAERELHARHSPIPTFNDRRRVRTTTPSLAPYDLTRGGTPLAYAQAATIKQQAAYIQDDIKAGNATFKLGSAARSLRRAESRRRSLQPRVGVSYAVPRQQHRAPRVVRPHAGDAVQREPAALERLSGSAASSATVSRCRRASATRSSSASSRASADGSSPTSATSTSNGQRLRLRRPVRHADRVPGVVEPFEDRRLHRRHQPGRARRLQRLRRHGAHQRDLLAAGQRRHPARGSRPATSGSTTTRSSTRPTNLQ